MTKVVLGQFLVGSIFILCFVTAGAQTSTSSRMNPDISVNGLLMGRFGESGNDHKAEEKNGFQLQELEVRFTSNIDAYLRGDVILAIHPEESEDPNEESGHASYVLEPEEAFVETLSLPSVTLRAGKFYALWGRHNQLHTHAFPFIDAPLVNTQLYGDEGFNDVGVAISYLVPFPWFFEVTAQGFSSQNENLFHTNSQDDVVGVYALKSLWDLSASTTFEWDLGYGHGRNQLGRLNHIYNSALTIKWRPIEKSTNQSVSFTTEYHQAQEVLDEDVSLGRQGGLSSWIQYQMKRHWWVQARGEYLGLPQPEVGITRRYSTLIGYVPTEFSAFRVQYDWKRDPTEEKDEQVVTLQLNVSMGSHPAHNY